MKRITKKDRIKSITEHMRKECIKRLYAIHTTKGEMVIVLYGYEDGVLKELEARELGKIFVISEKRKKDGEDTNTKSE